MNTNIQSVQGTAQLASDAVVGITNTVERMHETFARHPLPWSSKSSTPTGAHGAIASGVYSAIRGVNQVLRKGIERSLAHIPETPGVARRSSAQIKAAAALNGVFGDHLEATDNPLATHMCLMTPGHVLNLNSEVPATSVPRTSAHLVVFVHGLGLSELSWNQPEAPGLGGRLKDELDCTPLYLRYNTGLHISTNGKELAEVLEQLCETWPVRIESLSLVGHSMGGLVIRSACWYAQQTKNRWLQNLQRVVCMGSPHHGAPLEKAGHLLDLVMQKTPYTEPLAFGRQRSAGIKDLRHGALLDEDWQGHDPDESRPDTRRTVPLLSNVEYFFVAATLGRDLHDPVGHLLGDLLVRLDSAVGSHRDDLKKLHIKSENCQVFHEKNHFDLLHNDAVHGQIIEWFSP